MRDFLIFFWYEGNNDLSGKNTPIANFSDIRCIKLDFGAE